MSILQEKKETIHNINRKIRDEGLFFEGETREIVALNKTLQAIRFRRNNNT